MADVLKKLVVLITGDSKGAVTAAEETAVGLEKAAVAQAKATVAADKLSVALAQEAVVMARNAGEEEALASATLVLIGAKERLAASTAASNVTQAEANYAQAERSLQSLTAATTQQTAQSRVMGAVTGASSTQLAVGALAAVAAEEKLASSFSNTTEAVRKFRDVSGTTTDEADRFVAMFNGLGVPVDTADTAVSRLAKTLGNNADALDKYGVTVARNKNGTVNLGETLLNVSDAFNSQADATKRDALAQAAFGRGYIEMLPVLRANRDALKEFGDAAARRGELWNDTDIRKGAEFAINMRDAKLSIEAVGHQLGGQAAGSFANFARVIALGASGLAFFLSWLTKVEQAVENFGARIARHIPLVERFAKALFGGSDAAKALGDAADGTGSSVDDLSAATQKNADAVDGLVGAVRSYTGATDKIQAANEQLAAAHDEVSKKVDDQAKATLDAAKANEDLTQAETDLIAAQIKAPLDLAKSRRDLADATLKAEQADQDALVAVEKFGRGSLTAREAAQAAADAHGDQADAAQKAADAEAAGLNTKDVVAAEQRIAEAKQHQADAAKEKARADAEDPVADIARAEQAVKDATLDELIARGKLNDAIATYNTQFRASITLADVLDGKADNFLTKILDGSAALAQANADASSLNARIQAANDAAIGAGTVDADGTTLGPQDSTKRASYGSTQNIYVNVVTNADPSEIAAEIAFAGRGRF